MAFFLTIRGAPPFELQPGVDVTIGRGRHCELSVYSTLLSREHARIRWERGQPVLFDLESLNGCFIGPDRISRHALRDGDVIRLGDLMILFREAETAPPTPDDEQLPAPFAEGELPDATADVGSETRLFSRTAALQQRVFDYDEIGWLAMHTIHLRQLLLDPWIAESNLAAWCGNVRDPAELWRLLQVGVVAPRDPRTPLRGLGALDAAALCSLTKRGERLREHLSGKRVHWNEMAALRYRVRQGKAFKPLRMIARAYRPGAGLKELDVARLLYELENIYAPDMGRKLLDSELRRLLGLGFLRPADGAKDEAWYPTSWDDGKVVIAERGFAMLEGFRLEES